MMTGKLKLWTPNGWTVGGRLLIGAILIALLIAMVAGAALVSNRNITSSFELLANDSLKEQEALGDIQAGTASYLNEVRRAVLFGEGENEEIRAVSDRLDTALAEYARIENEYHTQDSGLENRNFAAQFRDVLSDMKVRGDTLLDLANTNVEDATLFAAAEALEAVENEMEALIAEAEDTLSREVTATETAVTNAVNRAQALVIIFSLSAFIVTFGISYLLYKTVVSRLQALAETARRITAGDLDEVAIIDKADEISEVAIAFNTMTGRLRDVIEKLEKRVDARTQQLETILKLSQRLTGILDLSDLLREVVTMTKESFGYYHTHIYLLESNTLVLTEGYGAAGATMKRQGHSIPLDAPQSLVARAAREGQAIVVQDVRHDSTWLPNPLLPDTHSEIAVPIKSGWEVLGVLDVQSEQVAEWTTEDVTTLEALANQVATAIRNAQAFTETREALYEAQRLQQLYIREGWEKLVQKQSTTNYEAQQPGVPSLKNVAPPLEVFSVLKQKQTVDLRLPAADKADVVDSKPAEARSALATPLSLRGQVIGVLGIHDNDPDRRWTEDEIALIEAVSEQMSLAIENARLFDETGRRANRERIIADMTQQVWASGDLEKVMQTAVEKLGGVLDASRVVIKLGTAEQLSQPSQAAE